MSGCVGGVSPYAKVDANLKKGNFVQADQVIAAAESSYGSTNRLLFLMDRGMTLHLAGKYKESTRFLEEADQLLEDLYTRRLRQEALSVLLNDSQRPFRGDPYEQVMVNVINAINYARLGDLDEALVEARRIDHRLNVLSDTADKDNYQEDPFARYLSGILYETAGDLNNAFVAYRKAYEGYELARSWSQVSIPRRLKEDLLRITDALHLSNEHAEYQQAFSDVTWKARDGANSAEVVVISFLGRAPHLEDQFLDVPISLEALGLVLQTKMVLGHRNQNARGVESVLYGLQGHIVRVALPRLVPQKSQVAYSQIEVVGRETSFQQRTELVHNVTSAAKKNLEDRFPSVLVRAVARAAAKLATAEGIGYGVAALAKDDETRGLVRAIVSALARIFAIGTEEADKRNWRTLPDVIHVARILLPPGEYTVKLEAVGQYGQRMGNNSEYPITLKAGETRILTSHTVF